ncbi:MAG: flavin reductase family protein [Thermodesulfobacteriota bacterium]|nr:flavin reductase family protein [Thermodesulfobacteriota bacterium]
MAPATLLYPAPAFLVTCISKTGKLNIITISWGGILCSKPPLLGISIQPSKYSYGLISETGEFVINIPTEELIWATDYCGNVSGSEEDKFSVANLTPLPAARVKPPVIKECPVNLECKVVQVLYLGSHDCFVGEVVAVQVNEEVLLSDIEGTGDPAFRETIDMEKCRPFVYLPGGGKYWNLKERIARVCYTKKPEAPEH